MLLVVFPDHGEIYVSHDKTFHLPHNQFCKNKSVTVIVNIIEILIAY